MPDEIISVGDPLPRIATAKSLGQRLASIVWRSGQAKVVDLAPVFASRRIYIPLRNDDALFQSLRVSEFGDAIEWDGGIDLAAIWIDRLPAYEFDNQAFRHAMERLGLSLEGMAAQLEISRRLVADYRKDKPIPRHIALATQYLVEHYSEAARN
jgi:hypothetical protein